MGPILKKISQIPLGFGGASISGEGGGYGFGAIDDQRAEFILKYAFLKGITVYDSAPIYGFGLSEIRIGRAFKNIREKVFLISKSGVTWHQNKRVNMTNDSKTTRKMLEQSLRDFDSDYIDCYMIHWPDEKIDIRRPMEVLSKAKDEGKIQHIGLSNTNSVDLKLAFQIDKIDVVQSELNLFNRKSSELFSFLNERKIDFMSWGTLDKGILTGRVDENRKFDPSDCRSWAPWWKKSDLKSKFDKTKKLQRYLEEHEISPLEMAIGHNFSYKEVTMALCGMKNEGEIDSAIQALDNLPNAANIKKALEIIDDGTSD